MEIVFNQSGLTTVFEQQIVDLAKVAESTMIDAVELLHLAASVQAAKLLEPDIIVEIGALDGKTTVFLHQILNLLGDEITPILSIDPFDRCTPGEMNPAGIYQRYLDNTLKANAADRCMPLVAFSQNAYKFVGDNIGLLMIDGCHHYEAIVNDLRLYSNKVRSGGILFIDDYDPQVFPDVCRAVDEFMIDRSDYQILHKSWFVIAQKTTKSTYN